MKKENKVFNKALLVEEVKIWINFLLIGGFLLGLMLFISGDIRVPINIHKVRTINRDQLYDINVGFNEFANLEGCSENFTDNDKVRSKLPNYMSKNVRLVAVEEFEDGVSHFVGLSYPACGDVIIDTTHKSNYNTITHEIGSVIDYRFSPVNEGYGREDWLSAQEEWIEVWNSEWDNTDSYGSSSSSVGFAEAFSAYHTGYTYYEKLNLKKDKPLSHKYMASLVEIIKDYDTE